YIGAYMVVLKKSRCDLLNHESGLKGICGDNDARNIEMRAKKGDKQARLAFEMCAYRIKKYIGAYMVVLK
ncbi:hypothetical protein JT140_08170, partial [Helicobacter pylori]|nr:hypothetical protein [Helicobacter pylori]